MAKVSRKRQIELQRKHRTGKKPLVPSDIEYPYHIVQLMPAIGWHAVYIMNGQEMLRPVVAWGLTDGSDVLPMVHRGDGCIKAAASFGDYRGLREDKTE